MAHEVGGAGVPARGQAHPARGREHGAGAVGEQPVEARDGGGAGAQQPRRAQARALGARVHAVAHQHQARGAHAARADGVQQDLGAGVVAGEERPRAEHLGAEATEHLGEPVERVGVAGMVLGVAVQRQVREHHAEAVGERIDGRFPLLVREQPGVQQRERAPGAELAVGDARAVGVVVEAQPHGSHRRIGTR